MADPKHPVWSLLRLLIIGGFLTVLLLCTASKFDRTEIITIVATLAAVASEQGVEHLLMRRT